MSQGERLILDPEVRLQQARDIAWAALNRREHTVAELRRVLERKRVDPADVAAVLDELVRERWVDDASYAMRFAEDRRHLDGWGSERIARRLHALGVDAAHVDAAVGDRPLEDERDAALELLRGRFPDPPQDPRERNSALGVLVRRGFNLELSHDVLRRYCGVGEFD